LHDLVSFSLLEGPSGAATTATSAQADFISGWKWLRSWAVKDGLAVSNHELKSLYGAALVEGECKGLQPLLSILKDEVASAL
jgi:hypothetical protein